MQQSSFTFNFYRFIGTAGHRTTEIVRDFKLADGMRGLVDRTPDQIQTATQKVSDWASSNGLSVTTQEPYPSAKYTGKVWLEFRFGGISL
jgi:hypothetical protein